MVGRADQIPADVLNEWLDACSADPIRFFKRKRIRKERSDHDTMGEIYFITRSDEGGHPIKIGYTRRGMYMRLKNIQVGNPHPLRIVATAPAHHSTELRLHEILQPHKLTGEWFEQAALVRDALQAALDKRLFEWVSDRTPPPASSRAPGKKAAHALLPLATASTVSRV